MKQTSTLDAAIQTKSAELTFLKEAKRKGMDHLFRGAIVTLPTSIHTKVPTPKKSKNQRPFSNADYQKMRLGILSFAKGKTSVNPKEVKKHLRTAGFKVKLQAVYTLLWTMKKEGHLKKASYGAYSSK